MVKKRKEEPPIPTAPIPDTALPSPLTEMEQKARETRAQSLEEARKREAFAKRFLEKEGFPPRVAATLERLSPEERLFIRQFMDHHAGEWNHYDGKTVGVVGVEVTDDYLVLTFLVIGEREEDDMKVIREIPRTPRAEEQMIRDGKIRPHRSTNTS